MAELKSPYGELELNTTGDIIFQKGGTEKLRLDSTGVRSELGELSHVANGNVYQYLPLTGWASGGASYGYINTGPSSNGPQAAFQPSSTDIVYLTETKFVLSYSEDDGSNHGFIVVGTVNADGTVSFGSAQDVDAVSYSENIQLAKLDENKIAFCYEDTFSTPTLKVCTAEITGTTITLGSKATIGTGKSSPSIVALDGQAFAIGYHQNGGNDGMVNLCDVSDSTITVQSANNVNSSGTNYMKLVQSDSHNMILLVTNGTGTSLVAKQILRNNTGFYEQGNTTVRSSASNTTLMDGAAYYDPFVDRTFFVACYNEGTVTYLRYYEISGTGSFNGGAASTTLSSVKDISIDFLSESSVVGTFIRSDDVLSAKVFEIYNRNVLPGGTLTKASGTVHSCRVSGSPNGVEFLMSYDHDSDGTPLKVASHKSFATDFYGFPDADYTSGQTINTIYAPGSVVTLSNVWLQIGKKYYYSTGLTTNGPETTSKADDIHYVGVAVASNKILIGG